MKNMNKIKIFLTVIFTLATFSASAQTEASKALLSGAVISIGEECVNDTVGLVVTENANSDWIIVNDVTPDALTNGNLGGRFEIHGIAYREIGTKGYIVLSADMPITGTGNSRAKDGIVSFGDLFINLSGPTFNLIERSLSKVLYGIRFSSTNNSGVDLGFYGGVSLKSVASDNVGFASYLEYDKSVREKGGIPGYGDPRLSLSYFGESLAFNVMDSGTKLSEINTLNASDINALGFPTNKFAGEFLFGVSFEAGLISDTCFKNQVDISVPELSTLSEAQLTLVNRLIQKLARRGQIKNKRRVDLLNQLNNLRLSLKQNLEFLPTSSVAFSGPKCTCSVIANAETIASIKEQLATLQKIVNRSIKNSTLNRLEKKKLRNRTNKRLGRNLSSIELLLAKIPPTSGTCQ
jgi:hypothetical protein